MSASPRSGSAAARTSWGAAAPTTSTSPASRLASRRALRWTALAIALLTVPVVARTVDVEALRITWATAIDHPLRIAGVLGIYAVAFLLRAIAWRRVVPGLRLGQALAALHVSLGGNHVLPARLGEPLRVTSVVRRAGTPLDVATASTVTLRAADLLAVGGLALLCGGPIAAQLAGRWLPILGALAGTVGVAGMWWLARLGRRGAGLRLPGAGVAVLTAVSWAAESVVIWQTAHWAGVPISAREAVAVTAVTIVAQVAAIAPGGIGTYEAAATAALVALGVPPSTGLAVAVSAHALKTGYALLTGAAATVLPAPGLFGRARLPRRRPSPGVTTARSHDGPVVLVLPAHDEEETVAAVVARAPATVAGHPVEVLVIDDGSTDDTATRAQAAGAHLVRMGANRGLGAAIRRGLVEACARGAAAVAFCDADGEYAPEELERMVAPILAGEADYVVGSRFGGEIERMLPHRRFGNVVLTAALRWVAREPISDGQSGYRALSPAAAAAAEIVHDYNYAQVLTLDLLGKGYRYAEVPISYRFRERGRSFVRLGRYLHAVVPAVHHEVNT